MRLNGTRRFALERLASAFLLAGWLCSGCDDAVKKPAQAHVPGQSSSRAATAQSPVTEVNTLPLPNVPVTSWVSLEPLTPGGIDYLIAEVQAKFAAGETNFKAGHLEAARRDFDDSVDWMLESGYDPNGDPRLAALFRHVTDTVYLYELQAFRAGDGFTEAPAVPGPDR